MVPARKARCSWLFLFSVVYISLVKADTGSLESLGGTLAQTPGARRPQFARDTARSRTSSFYGKPLCLSDRFTRRKVPVT